jgi:hypothetical protein
LPKAPSWSKITANNEGVVTIYFSENLFVPPSINYINNTVVDLKIIPYDVEDIGFLNFDWNVIEFTS